jgi:peptidoglycan/LPS O-acetylase OafA/YrhL
MQASEPTGTAVLEHAGDMPSRLLGANEGARRLKSIDALRGLAALAVVLTHIPREHSGQPDAAFFALLPIDFGTLGVPLFLVISGFCIHLAVARRALAGQQASVDWAAFWKRRFYRLYPPYLAAIAFSLVAYALVSAFGHVPPGRQLESVWTDLASHMLLVHNILPAFADGLFNPAFWTLALEEQLYALFALLLVLRRRMSIVRVLVISLGIAVLWRVGITWLQFFLVREAGIPREAHLIEVGALPAIGAWANWPFAWWFLWVLGAVAAEGYTRTTTLPRWCYSPLVACSAAAFGALTYFRTLGRYTEFWLTDQGAQGWWRAGLNSFGGLSELAFGVSFFVLLNRWVRAEQDGRFTQRWAVQLTSVGVFSYSLYLVHHPTIAVLETWLPLGPRTSLTATLMRIVLYVPICVAVGYAFFYAVERHFLRHRKGQWLSWVRAGAFARWRNAPVTPR